MATANPFEKPVDAFLKNKWNRVFYHFFDLNKSGTIDWNDFEVLFEKVKEIRGESSNEYKIVVDSMLMVWKGLLIQVGKAKETDNVDKKAEISVQEWDRIWREYDPAKPHHWQQEYLKFMFFLIDTSGDKLIDVGEYVEVMKMYGVSENSALRAYKKTCSKAIDYGEFVRLWNEYFTSTDKDARGSWLFGPPTIE